MKGLTTDWNLTDIYQTEEEASADFEKLKKEMQKYLSFKGKLSTKDGLLKYFKFNDQVDALQTRLGAYLMLRLSLDGKDKFATKIQGEYDFFSNEFMPKLAFIETEQSKIKASDLLAWKKLKSFENYQMYLDSILRSKRHSLSTTANKILSALPNVGATEEAFDKFDSVDVKFGTINTPDGKVALTPALYSKYVEHNSQKVRKDAYNTFNRAYHDHNYLLTSLYLSSTKEDNFFVKMRKYKSKLAASCEGIQVNPKIIPTLFSVVRKNLPLFYRFERIKKEALGLKKYYYFDNYAPVADNLNSYSYEEATNIMLNVLDVYGEEYTSVVKRALTENWIDVYEKPAKTKGGFSLGVYGYHPYILLNYGGTFGDVSTLCHEMGHTMHSFLSDKSQPISKAGYSIFVAEVASTVNENLLCLYMLENAKTKQEKLYYIHHFLFQFYATVFRQTMFEEFEHFVITSTENKVPLTAEDLNEKYAELQNLYFGKGALKTEESKYEWSRISHFYRPYYVYKYATGFIAAIIISKNLHDKKPGYLEKYLKFLSSGGSEYPLDLLKAVEVDFTNEKTLDVGFKVYEEYLNTFEEIVKEK